MQNNESRVNNILASALHSLSYDEINELISNLQERLPKEDPAFGVCLNCGDKNHSGLDCPQFKESLQKAIEKRNKETNLEQELEDAAEIYAEQYNYIGGKISFIRGATSDIAKKIHQQGMFTEEEMIEFAEFSIARFLGKDKISITNPTEYLQTFLNQTK